VADAGGPVRVVCFDLGGVVVRICRSWAEGLERAGVAPREAEMFDDMDFVGQRHRLTDDYMSGKIGCGAFFEGLSRATGGAYSVDEVRAIHDAWVLEEYPGMLGLIEELNALGTVETACLSNTNHAHWAPLMEDPGRSPAIRALRRRLVSHELGAVKPDAVIYELAEAELGARGDEIVFFDDLEANVDAASSRGWRARLIDHAGRPSEQARAALVELGVLGADAPGALSGRRSSG
jgi:HAD superfamily hydrolase (TIGR01509 family)